MRTGFFIGILIIFFISIVSELQAQEKLQSQQNVIQDTSKVNKRIKLLLRQIEVRGWIEKPQMVYVVPGVNPEIDDILLDRSFLDEILRPLDKEKFEKQKLILRRKVVIPW